ncbi:MAG: response regulator [Chloroflexota bacterium]
MREPLPQINPSECTILIVDDNPTNLGVISDYLKSYGFEILTARSGDMALKRVEYARPDIILMDVMMPGLNGFETCQTLKFNENTRSIPVIFMTALADTEDKVKGFQAGGVDYVTKPIQQEEVLARVTAHLQISKLTANLTARNDELQKTSKDLNYLNEKMLQVTERLRGANAMLARRALQLETNSQVSQNIASYLELSQLLPEVVKIIQAKFGYYFVAVNLIDESKEHIVLQACIGRDGRQPIQPGFSLPLADEPKSISASACRACKIQVVNDVSREPAYFAVAELPETRAELVVPLCVGQEVMGVLDIQHDQCFAFAPEDCALLQALANQIAIAIRNAQSYGIVKRLHSLEEERAQALSKLNADKDKFFSIISHDLRSPFNSLLGNIQLVKEMFGSLSAHDMREILDSIHRQAKLAYTLLDNLLTWTRMQREGGMVCQPERVELAGLVRDTIDVLKQPAEDKNVHLENAMPSDLYVFADRQMLYTIMRNLTNNAIKFTPGGGTVTLDASPYGEGEVKISVRDTGVGIAPENLDKIFQLGVSHSTPGTAQEQGTGLGLLICKDMVACNGGQLTIQSSLGAGTTVAFNLPTS